MTAAFPKGWREGHIPKRDSVDQHPELIAWEATEDALRGNPECSCYDVATMEWAPTPCDSCRSRDLAAIDLDGHDDKRETPGAA